MTFREICINAEGADQHIVISGGTWSRGLLGETMSFLAGCARQGEIPGIDRVSLYSKFAVTGEQLGQLLAALTQTDPVGPIPSIPNLESNIWSFEQIDPEASYEVYVSEV